MKKDNIEVVHQAPKSITLSLGECDDKTAESQIEVLHQSLVNEVTTEVLESLYYEVSRPDNDTILKISGNNLPENLGDKVKKILADVKLFDSITVINYESDVLTEEGADELLESFNKSLPNFKEISSRHEFAIVKTNVDGGVKLNISFTSLGINDEEFITMITSIFPEIITAEDKEVQEENLGLFDESKDNVNLKLFSMNGKEFLKDGQSGFSTQVLTTDQVTDLKAKLDDIASKHKVVLEYSDMDAGEGEVSVIVAYDTNLTRNKSFMKDIKEVVEEVKLFDEVTELDVEYLEPVVEGNTLDVKLDTKESTVVDLVADVEDLKSALVESGSVESKEDIESKIETTEEGDSIVTLGVEDTKENRDAVMESGAKVVQLFSVFPDSKSLELFDSTRNSSITKNRLVIFDVNPEEVAEVILTVEDRLQVLEDKTTEILSMLGTILTNVVGEAKLETFDDNEEWVIFNTQSRSIEFTGTKETVNDEYQKDPSGKYASDATSNKAPGEGPKYVKMPKSKVENFDEVEDLEVENKELNEEVEEKATETAETLETELEAKINEPEEGEVLAFNEGDVVDHFGMKVEILDATPDEDGNILVKSEDEELKVLVSELKLFEESEEVEDEEVEDEVVEFKVGEEADHYGMKVEILDLEEDEEGKILVDSEDGEIRVLLSELKLFEDSDELSEVEDDIELTPEEEEEAFANKLMELDTEELRTQGTGKSNPELFSWTESQEEFADTVNQLLVLADESDSETQSKISDFFFKYGVDTGANSDEVAESCFDSEMNHSEAKEFLNSIS